MGGRQPSSGGDEEDLKEDAPLRPKPEALKLNLQQIFAIWCVLPCLGGGLNVFGRDRPLEHWHTCGLESCV